MKRADSLMALDVAWKARGRQVKGELERSIGWISWLVLLIDLAAMSFLYWFSRMAPMHWIQEEFINLDPQAALLLPYMMLRSLVMSCGKAYVLHLTRSPAQRPPRATNDHSDTNGTDANSHDTNRDGNGTTDGDSSTRHNGTQQDSPTRYQANSSSSSGWTRPRVLRSALTVVSLTSITAASFFVLHNGVLRGQLGFSEYYSVIAGVNGAAPEYAAWSQDNLQDLTVGLGVEGGAMFTALEQQYPGTWEVWTRAANEYDFPTSFSLRECLREGLDSVSGYPVSTLCKVVHMMSPGILTFLKALHAKAKGISGRWKQPDLCDMMRGYMSFYAADEAEYARLSAPVYPGCPGAAWQLPEMV